MNRKRFRHWLPLLKPGAECVWPIYTQTDYIVYWLNKFESAIMNALQCIQKWPGAANQLRAISVQTDHFFGAMMSSISPYALASSADIKLSLSVSLAITS